MFPNLCLILCISPEFKPMTVKLFFFDLLLKVLKMPDFNLILLSYFNLMSSSPSRLSDFCEADMLWISLPISLNLKYFYAAGSCNDLTLLRSREMHSAFTIIIFFFESLWLPTCHRQVCFTFPFPENCRLLSDLQIILLRVFNCRACACRGLTELKSSFSENREKNTYLNLKRL